MNNSITASPFSSRRVVGYWPALLIVLAWVLTLTADVDGYGYIFDHHALIHTAIPWGVAAILFLLSWQLMYGGMMLPGSLPLLARLGEVRGEHDSMPARAHRHAAFIAGSAVVWSEFALVAFIGDSGVHQLVDAWPWLDRHSWLIAGLTLVTAGVYQLSPPKRRYRTRCADPNAFFAHHVESGMTSNWLFGLKHGRSCLGSDWALMMIMFGLGIGNLLWMAGLTAVMLIEKTMVRGHTVAILTGLIILVWGTAVLAHPVWLPPALTGKS